MKTSERTLECAPHEQFDETALLRLRQALPEAGALLQMTQTFSALGDPTRLQLLLLLLRQPLCVHDLAQALGMSESAVSHQLRTLRMLRLVSARRAGRRVYYSLEDHHVRHLLEETLHHTLER